MSIPRRAAAATGAVLVCLCVLAVRLAQVQVFAAAEYRDAASRQRLGRVTLPEPRGEIRDVNGSPLAYSEIGFDLWAETSRLDDPAAAARALAAALGPCRRSEGRDAPEVEQSSRGADQADERDIFARLSGADRCVCVRRSLSMEAAGRVRGLSIAGLRLAESARRVYPMGPAACHVLGVVGVDGRGLEGLEYAWDDVLAGRPGMLVLSRDGHGRVTDTGDGRQVPGRPGANVRLTLDAGVQRIVFEEMSRAAERLEPAGGAGIVIDPATGDVRALVSWPAFDPLDRGRASPGHARNRAIMDALEPGSTFKPFVVGWAVERGLARPGETIDCEAGVWRPFAGKTVRDMHPFGTLTLEEILILSSNVGAAKIGARLGIDGLFACVKAFGFGDCTGIGLPGENRGLVGPRSAWSSHTVASLPFGQELAVPPLQLATGYAALVNGGLLVRPRLIDGLEDESGRAIREPTGPEPVRVLSEDTSRWVRLTLARAVADPRGTGRRAMSERVVMGGKTGTAQKYERDPATGRMRVSESKVVASFVGFVPVENPALVGLVLWDEPKGSPYGGTAAAPVVARIFERMFDEIAAYRHCLAPKDHTGGS